MYYVQIPKAINQMIKIFYKIRFWNDKATTTVWEKGIKLFHFLFYLSFMISFAVEAFLTDDGDEMFLIVAFLVTKLFLLRVWYIIQKKSEILTFIQQLGTHATIDQEEFIKINNKLETFTKFTKGLIATCCFNGGLAVIFSMVREDFGFPWKTNRMAFLLTNLGFPWETNRIAFCLTNLYSLLGSAYSILTIFFAIIIWYIMLNCAIRYDILGNQLRNMGMKRTEKLFLHDFLEANKIYETTHKIIVNFTSTFSNLFLLHIFLSKIQICGSVYILAFSAHENWLQDGLYCFILMFNLLDILVIMYLGNEIKVSSDRLSYCLFESNWIEQTQMCKKYIIIMSIYLQQPQELKIAKLYPLNLHTYTTIVNAAYSLLNILKNSNIRH